MRDSLTLVLPHLCPRPSDSFPFPLVLSQFLGRELQCHQPQSCRNAADIGHGLHEVRATPIDAYSGWIISNELVQVQNTSPTSSYLAISGSRIAGVGGRIGAATGSTAGAGAIASAGRGLGVAFLRGSCDEDASFDGEPGLGGREGWMGELPTPTTGRGAARVPGEVSARGVKPSGLLGAGSKTVMDGVAFAASEARALARAEIFSNLCFLCAIRTSSNLIFFTKSLTSPALQYPDVRKANEKFKMPLTGIESVNHTDWYSPFPRCRSRLPCPNSISNPMVVLSFFL